MSKIMESLLNVEKGLAKMKYRFILQQKMKNENMTFEEAKSEILKEKILALLKPDNSTYEINDQVLSENDRVLFKTICDQDVEANFIGTKEKEDTLHLLFRQRSGFILMPLYKIVPESVFVYN